jgi:hypothetical protein
MTNESDKHPRFVTCPCQHCDGHIEFDASQIELTGSATGMTTGQTVPCPHCGLETIIFVPHQNAPPSDPMPIPIASPLPKQPATVPPSSLIKSLCVKLTSRAAAVFFAFTTFCLASILVWEHCNQPFFTKEPIYQAATTTKHVPTGAFSRDKPVLVAEKIQVGEKQVLTTKGWIAIIVVASLTPFCIGIFLLTWKRVLDSDTKKHQRAKAQYGFQNERDRM